MEINKNLDGIYKGHLVIGFIDALMKADEDIESAKHKIYNLYWIISDKAL